MTAVMHNLDRLDLQVQPIELGSNQLKDFKVAHLTGVAKTKLTEPQWKELGDFVKGGGTLIIDSAGGNEVFTNDMLTQLAANFPSGASQLEAPLPGDHLLFTQIAEPVEIRYRTFARHVLLENMRMPRLRGMDVNGRIGIFFSAEDISGGLVGEPVDGIVGYDPATATALMRKMILYAESGGKPVAATAQPQR